MTDRDRNRGRRPQRQGGSPQRSVPSDRPAEPAIPDEVSASDLDSETRRDLLTLDKSNAEAVARHLVMVADLLYEDPALALEHARAARRRATRVGVVRETAGIAAYNAGEWQEAISELRAARRITGSSSLLPLIADAERGLGRPERAIEIARSDEGRALTGDEATELRIVEAGARTDLGEPDKALVTLQLEDLSPGRTGTAAARVFYAYASALEAAGRIDDAMTWFMNASAADIDDATDAEFRLMELSVGGEPAEASSDEVSPDETALDRPVLDEPVPDKRDESAPDESSEDGAPLAALEAVEADDEVAAPAVPEVAEPEVETQTSDPVPVLTDVYDALLLDLDGTVFAGHRPVAGAVDTLRQVDRTTIFVTNNASRRPTEVAEHLVGMGFDATPDQVVTSAQSAARLLSEHLEPGSRALVLGTDGLAQEVREVGIAVTRSADDRPLAVIQGYSPDTSWATLSEAALAIRAGALWIATNVDATLPSERGLLVGNGSLVAAVANATGQEPLVAGKPAAPLMADAITRSAADKPLVIGDRLDTDIQGAHSVGLDSLLVLTGVSTPTDLLSAPPQQRPTYVAADLSGVLDAVDTVRISAKDAWRVARDGNTVSVSPTTDAPDFGALLPALAAQVWEWADADEIDLTELVVTGTSDAVRTVLAELDFDHEA
ncbi:HAD-IIA family hydrolase [Gordonia sp. VNK1]|jgi:HAD superfamily hydrolase (TIGR01450 family)|uniref:HAD-IIA family hydrolase n=1 Tax=Gordonia oleivorans TaxID=3156618 RepID=UPI0032B40E81